VTKIESALITEGSVYSAEKNSDGTWAIYNKDKKTLGINGLPDYQLYIKGSVLSHNTIGGATPVDHNTAQCPYNVGECNFDTAIPWDMNYFRDWKTIDTTRR
jgi:hypothetical protein